MHDVEMEKYNRCVADPLLYMCFESPCRNIPIIVFFVAVCDNVIDVIIGSLLFRLWLCCQFILERVFGVTLLYICGSTEC
jgi:hypothetical protein